MAKIKIVAGDLEKGNHDVVFSILKVPNRSKLWEFQEIDLAQSLCKAEVITEQNKKAIGGTLIGGVAGLALLGPLGAIGGMLVGGNKRRVSFVAELLDGRKFMAQANSEVYVKIQSWAMGNTSFSDLSTSNVDLDIGDPQTKYNDNPVEFPMGVPKRLFDQYIELSEDQNTVAKSQLFLNL